MLRLIVKSRHSGTFKSYDFPCAGLEKDIKNGHAYKLVGLEILKEIPQVLPLPTGSVPRLISYDDDKIIPVIKAIRAHTGLGLKEAKEVADSAPCDLLFPEMKSATMSLLIRDLQEAGATVALPAEEEKEKGS